MPAREARTLPPDARRPVGAARRLTPWDAATFAAGLAACVASALAAWTPSVTGRLLVVEHGDERWIYPLSADATIAVRGDLGESVIAIEGGSARFVESACANKTCVFSGPIDAAGEWVACLPNRVVARIAGEGAELDGLSW